MNMMAEELGFELRSMVNYGEKHSEKVAMIVLFGIKYAADLEDVRVADVIKEAFGETPSWAPEIGIGKKLAKYVTLK